MMAAMSPLAWNMVQASQWAVQGAHGALGARCRLCWRVTSARQANVSQPHDAVSTTMRRHNRRSICANAL